ncbi:Beta-glucuronosyltransferase GlcAT14B [Vitis vinifera]|uniref:Beta-glucuronosyltransferase GlcAT14B n=1 Tax=Vitis vinifera TaxID=29760 RepID=A0A438ENS1_VITVI|nr:Beta-glucuronosyltransferase GlcAT14B [Vitis vinifera]
MTHLTLPLLVSLLSLSVLIFLLFLLPPPPPPTTTLTLHRHFPSNPLPPPPKLAYFISGTHGDSPRLLRLLRALYHPNNQYLLHLDRRATPQERVELSASVGSVAVFAAAENVNVVGSADAVNLDGSTPIASLLRGAAIYLLHILSFVPRDFNFIEHTSNIGWNEYQRIIQIVVDPGLYLASKRGIFLDSDSAHKLIFWVLMDLLMVGIDQVEEWNCAESCSPQVILSRKLVEFSILGWDNFPRTLLLFFANIKSSHRGYFQTLACNAREFSNTVMNSNLRYMAWDNPPGKEPRNPRVSDVKKMLGSGAAFAGNFAPNDHEVLDLIDSVVLHRRKGMISPGGWCVGRRDRGRDPCQHWGDTNILRPGHAAERFEKLLLRVMANSTLRSNQCR